MVLYGMLAVSASVALYLGIDWAWDRVKRKHNRRAMRRIVEREEADVR
ncbi:hypothetical protein [Rhodoligotrophos defluvii]|nr:hypothetical protein [Rhodoligotrophos defluvii]